MATTRRPSRARPSSSKAAKARPAPARPSTSKPRAQGKPGPVSSEPETSGRKPGLRVEQSTVLQVAKAGWSEILRLRRQLGIERKRAAKLQVAAKQAETDLAAERTASRKATAFSQVLQIACKRMRSVLGPLGQGADDVSTTGHMLAMIQSLTDDYLYLRKLEQAAVEAIQRTRAIVGDDSNLSCKLITDLATIPGSIDALLSDRSAADAVIATVIAEIRALLGETEGTPNTPEIMLGLVRRLIAAFNANQESTPKPIRPIPDALKALRGVLESAGGIDRLQIRQAQDNAWNGMHIFPIQVKSLADATLAAVRADPPATDFAPNTDTGPRCEEKGQCEDLDGSGACTGCGRWLGGEAKEASPAASGTPNVGSAVAHPGAPDVCQDLGSGRCWICDRVMP